MTLTVAVPRETLEGETRVALTPDAAGRMVKKGLAVLVQSGAGERAYFPDEAYVQAGATMAADAASLVAADIVVRVQPPAVEDVDSMKPGCVLVSLLQPAAAPGLAERLAARKVSSFSLNLLPRTTRAQAMDVLSSMATIAGYKAPLIAAERLPKFFPMLVTAAGTMAPAKALILGAGVAGLQAIATAKRIGAVVSAFDVRRAVKEQVQSLGARFLEVELAQGAEGAGGYARELSEEDKRRTQELVAGAVKDADVVITTAQIPGKRAPILVTTAMLAAMRPGSVIVDLAAEGGGNCEGTEPGREVVVHGVTIVAPLNLPATMPVHASQMYARNISAFLDNIVKKGELALDFGDEIIRDSCVTHGGEMKIGQKVAT
jgi:NAD(P) transhydrogenase subunit alpha